MGRANREKHEGHVMEHNHFASSLLLFLFSFDFSEYYCGGVSVRQESAQDKLNAHIITTMRTIRIPGILTINLKSTLRAVLPYFVSMTTLKIPGLAGSVRGSMFTPR